MTASRIAVFRALQLGDMLCAVPALRALRTLYPHAHITLIGLPWAKTLQHRFHRYLDEVVPFPGFPGLPECEPNIDALLGFLRNVQGRFDLAIQLHGSGGLTNQILQLFNARRCVGFHAKDGRCPDPQSWWPYPEDEHEIHRNLRLMQYLGAPSGDTRLEFPILQTDRAEADSWKYIAGMDARPYVCLHAGARSAHKRWPAQLFAQIGDAIVQRGYQLVLTGSASERPIAAAVAAAMRAPALNLACGMSIGAMAALIAGARLAISNDTGAAHLAVAVDTPAVVIFVATDVKRWAPLDRRRHHVIADSAGVGVDAVLASIDAALADVR